jgi:cell division septum initiation protein DivIVA
VSLPQSSIIDQIADHRDELLNENRQLKQRIKRLEEVGDEVVINYVNSLSAFEMWRKAKEAKL